MSRVGLFLPSVSPSATPEFLTAYATAAEDAGFDSIWIGEHVVFLDDYKSRYPYAEDGRLSLPSDAGMLELFTTLTYLGAVTDRIRLGTAVCLVPQRNPVYTAKAVATADWLTGGRVDFGIGIGWLREEFEVLDAPFSDRAARTRDYVRVMHACWRDELSAYDGEHYHLPPCRMYPKPVQTPNPPVYFGGETDAALQRVASLGDGWCGFNHRPDSAGASVQRLGRFLDDAGRARRRGRRDHRDVPPTGAGLRPVGVPRRRRRPGGAHRLRVRRGRGRETIAALGDEFVGVAADL